MFSRGVIFDRFIILVLFVKEKFARIGAGAVHRLAETARVLEHFAPELEELLLKFLFFAFFHIDHCGDHDHLTFPPVPLPSF